MMETGNDEFQFQVRPARHLRVVRWRWARSPTSTRTTGTERYPPGTTSWPIPNYDEFWQKQAVTPYLDAPKVPNLNVAGWWDQEDFYGPMKIYETLEKKDTNHMNYRGGGTVEPRWLVARRRAQAGRHRFRQRHRAVLPRESAGPVVRLLAEGQGSVQAAGSVDLSDGLESLGVLRSSGRRAAGLPTAHFISKARAWLSFAKPEDDRCRREFDSYVSDPAHPVPYRHRPISPTYPDGGWPTWLVEDQRFVQLRPDVLSWETDPLQQDVAVAGDIVAHLFASTSGTDSDWIVKLIDVYPEDYPKDAKMGGYQLMIADEVFRARFRESFTHPKAVTPDEVTEYAIDLHTNNHAFLKGHRIMVQVQSTWFPVIDRNPQTFVENIYKATEADYKPATQRVYRSGKYASHVTLPVLK